MREFILGWRRKLGCVTLVMALVFMGGWIRCFYVEDWIFLDFGDKYYLLRSDRGGFSCNGGDGPLPKRVQMRGSQPVSPVAIVVIGPARRDDFFIYYSGVAIPLTLLSAYLILWKPRRVPNEVRA